MTPSAAKTVLFDAFDRFGSVNVSRLAAAFAFFGILSLAPSLLFAVLVAAQVLGNDARALDSVLTLVRENLGKETVPFVKDLISSAQKPGSGVAAAIFGLAVTFFSASNLFLQFVDSIDTIWARKAEGSLVRVVLIARLKAFLGVLGFGLVTLSWLILDGWLSWLRARTGAFLGWAYAAPFVAFFFLTAVMLVLFRSLPRGRVTWRDAIPGAVVASLGCLLARTGLGYYFQVSGVFKAYGAAGALVAILLFIFYTAQIVFFGAVLTRSVVALRTGELSAEPKSEPVDDDGA